MKKFVKSPFNYIGGKYKLLPQITPLFPKDIGTFYDIFGGGGNVGINVNSEKVYYNDIVHYVSDVFSNLQKLTTDEALDRVKTVVSDYQLSRTNTEGFLKLREDYNNGLNSWEYFYTLVVHSFNDQFRFNNSHKYNSSFGRNRSDFNSRKEKNFIDFMDRLTEIDIEFDSKDFKEIDFSKVGGDDFVYCDPPYIISIGNYNDGKRGFNGWSEEDESELHSVLDDLGARNVRFALSNVTHHQGVENRQLIDWAKKYNTHEIKSSYSNANYRKKNREELTREVLITNY